MKTDLNTLKAETVSIMEWRGHKPVGFTPVKLSSGTVVHDTHCERCGRFAGIIPGNEIQINGTAIIQNCRHERS
jgi:hypothetical protein